MIINNDDEPAAAAITVPTNKRLSKRNGGRGTKKKYIS